MWPTLSYTHPLKLCPTSLQDYQPHTTSSPSSFLKCLSCSSLLLTSHKQLPCSNLPKDPVLGRIICPQPWTSNESKCLSCKQMNKTTHQLPRPSGFSLNGCSGKPWKVWWGHGKISSPWGRKNKKAPLPSRGGGWAVLQPWHHGRKMTSEHMPAPAMFPHQGVTCQLAFGPTELCAGCLKPWSCY